MIAVAGGDGDLLCTPCGACRQRIREFGDVATPVLVGGPDGFQRRFTLGELLPESFGPESFGPEKLADWNGDDLADQPVP